jgi:mono/diheme cytochrome c family protein
MKADAARRPRWLVPFALISLYTAVVAQAPAEVPRIWDDTVLVDWATPVAALKLRPAHYSSAEYYSVPGDNLRTYPVYSPDAEPVGYWEGLQKKKPEPLLDVAKIRTAQDWIAAGERAFVELDTFWMRTNDPSVIAQAREARNFEGVAKRPDGTVGDARWVVTPQGVMLSRTQCSSCHRHIDSDGNPTVARRAAGPRTEAFGLGDPAFLVRALPRFFVGDTLPMAMWRMFTVPWAPDDRVEQLRTANVQELSQQEKQRLTMMGTGEGVFPRPNGSPFYAAKIPDLRLLKYSRYIDATGTHRLRGPGDIARYAALITGADRMDFGPHRLLTDEQRRVRFRYADEVLYAIGMYLLSLEPPKNPNPPPPELVARGQEVFRRENCSTCHPAPSYTTGELTPVDGFDVPPDHPNGGDVRSRSVGTDPGLALKTRKATGFYKIPSLRGLWYRPRLLHDASITSLEELFDPARLAPEYERKGWTPRGVTKGAIPGLEFLPKLNADDKRALIAFLRSL